MRHRHDTTPPHDAGLPEAVAAWLAAEKAIDDAPSASGETAENAADEALFAVFGALPGLSPSAGFADQVLMQAGVTRRRSRDLAVHFRVLAAAAFISTALAYAVLVPTAWALLDTIGPASAVASLCQNIVALFAGALHAAVDLLSVGQSVATLARALWLLVTSPQGASFLLLLTALTFGLSRWLVTLVATPRSFRHATPA